MDRKLSSMIGVAVFGLLLIVILGIFSADFLRTHIPLLDFTGQPRPVLVEQSTVAESGSTTGAIFVASMVDYVWANRWMIVIITALMIALPYVISMRRRMA